MYELLIGAIVILLLFNAREHFSFGGKEILNMWPVAGEDTCPPDKEMSVGLCYPKCRPGYYGAMTMCVMETKNIGIGKVIGMADCPQGWSNDGLTCREPLSGGCSTYCDGNWSWDDGGFCHTKCSPITGGRTWGRLGPELGPKCPGPQGGIEGAEEPVDGMCYNKCPAEYPRHMPAMPYLCGRDGPLTYDRGAGKVPAVFRVAGKYPILQPP